MTVEKTKFPELVYVERVDEDDTSFLSTFEDAKDALGSDDTVKELAVYRLDRIVTATKTVTFEVK